MKKSNSEQNNNSNKGHTTIPEENLPKLYLFKNQEYQDFLQKLESDKKNANEQFLCKLNISLKFEEVLQFITTSVCTVNVLFFFMNYIKNEDMIRGPGLSKNLFILSIQVKINQNKDEIAFGQFMDMNQLLIEKNFDKNKHAQIGLIVFYKEKFTILLINIKKKNGFICYDNSLFSQLPDFTDMMEDVFKDLFQIKYTDYILVEYKLNYSGDQLIPDLLFLYKYIMGADMDNLYLTSHEQRNYNNMFIWLLSTIRYTDKKYGQKSIQTDVTQLPVTEIIKAEKKDFSQQITQPKEIEKKISKKESQTQTEKAQNQSKDMQTMKILTSQKEVQTQKVISVSSQMQTEKLEKNIVNQHVQTDQIQDKPSYNDQITQTDKCTCCDRYQKTNSINLYDNNNTLQQKSETEASQSNEFLTNKHFDTLQSYEEQSSLKKQESMFQLQNDLLRKQSLFNSPELHDNKLAQNREKRIFSQRNYSQNDIANSLLIQQTSASSNLFQLQSQSQITKFSICKSPKKLISADQSQIVIARPDIIITTKELNNFSNGQQMSQNILNFTLKMIEKYYFIKYKIKTYAFSTNVYNQLLLKQITFEHFRKLIQDNKRFIGFYYVFIPAFSFYSNSFFLGVFNLINQKFIYHSFGKNVNQDNNDIIFHNLKVTFEQEKEIDFSYEFDWNKSQLDKKSTNLNINSTALQLILSILHYINFQQEDKQYIYTDEKQMRDDISKLVWKQKDIKSDQYDFTSFPF